jgi:hypothetical protein
MAVVAMSTIRRSACTISSPDTIAPKPVDSSMRMRIYPQEQGYWVTMRLSTAIMPPLIM